MMKLILKYFADLTESQIHQFEQLEPLYRDWNAKINVISRKDIDHLYEHHILHSLAIAKFIRFGPGSKVLDLGTGGGFPGIPLAIVFPETTFTLIDGTLKKLNVVKAVAEALELKNVEVIHIRAEELKKRKFDFVVSRAVAELAQLVAWATPLISQKHMHALPNGLIALKGGKIKAEMKELPRGSYVEYTPIKDFFKEEYFKEKYVVYVQG